jgi:hypothetical protein
MAIFSDALAETDEPPREREQDGSEREVTDIHHARGSLNTAERRATLVKTA